MRLSIKYYISAILSIVTLTCTAQKVTFALLTDMHIDLTNTQTTQHLADAIADINSNQLIEFVLIAGDVTDKGDSLSLEKAKKMLQKLAIPYYITFGNHDVISSDSINRIYLKVFGNDKFSFTHKNIHYIGFSTYPELQYGEGYCSKTDLNWIDSTLNKLNTSTPILAITHYPLQKGDVKNWSETTDVLRKFNVQCILNGHYHRNALLMYNNIPGIVNRSTIGKNQAPGGYSIYTIDQEIQVSEKLIGLPAEQWLQLPMEQKNYNN